MLGSIQLDKPLVFFDLETTGKESKTARIVEISVTKILPDKTTQVKTRRFNPGVPIPAEATEVHGITDEDVKDEPPFAALANGLLAFLEGCDLAGYNLIKFDLPVLEQEFKRADKQFSIEGRLVLDVMKIFHKKEPRDLEAAVRFYLEREHDGAHSAEADVSATVDILGAMVSKYSDLPQNLTELCALLRDPSQLDLSGKIVAKEGEPHLTFGKHLGKSLAWVATHDQEYIRWIVHKGDFLEDTKAIAAKYLST
jgi:DNA polymerase-3 subunit epsilon